MDWYSGVIFSDVLDEGPKKLRYVSYPTEDESRSVYTYTDRRSRSGEVGRHRSHPAAAPTAAALSMTPIDIDIWTLNTDAMAWVLETETDMVDSTELWKLPNAPGYARVHLVHPVATMDGAGIVVASMNGVGDAGSDDSLGVSKSSARVSINGGLQGGNGAASASRRRRRANSMVTGPKAY